MIRSGFGAAFTAGIVFCLSGCGTAANTLWFTPEEGGMRVYGGVRADAEVARESVTDLTNSKTSAPRESLRSVALCVLDLPLSAVADTLTLPVTICATIKRQAESGGARATPAQAGPVKE